MAKKDSDTKIIPTPNAVVEEDEEKKPSAFDKFFEEHRSTWIKFNIFVTLLSIGLAIAIFFILTKVTGDCKDSSIRFVLWVVFCLHSVNAVETLISLTGLDEKICGSKAMIAFLLFEVIVLIYMQAIYFNNQ
jgi:predicted membrane channel-forming protein YqfA (hemolysin III family)